MMYMFMTWSPRSKKMLQQRSWRKSLLLQRWLMMCHLIKPTTRATPSMEQLSQKILMRNMMGDKLIVIMERWRNIIRPIFL